MGLTETDRRRLAVLAEGRADNLLFGRPPLPEQAEPGEYVCQECGRPVTVGPTGTEYGHAAGVYYEECPRRAEQDVPQFPRGRGGGAHE